MIHFKKIIPILFISSMLFAGSAPRISTEKVKSLIGKKGVIILDVRTSWDWRRSKLKIKGAIRENYKKFDSWYRKYSKGKTLILYCAWPNEKTSASLVQKYISKGYSKVYALKGGWNAWEKAGYPTEKLK